MADTKDTATGNDEARYAIPREALADARRALSVLTGWLNIQKDVARKLYHRDAAPISEALELPRPWSKDLSERYDSFTEVQRLELFTAQANLLWGNGSADTDTFTPAQADFLLDWYRLQLAASSDALWKHFKTREYHDRMAQVAYEARYGTDDEPERAEVIEGEDD